MPSSPRIVTVRTHQRLTARALFVSVSIAGEPHVAQGGSVELQLCDGDTGAVDGQWRAPQRPVMRRRIRRLLPGARREVCFPLDKIPLGSGAWWIKARFIDRHGRECLTQTLQDSLDSRPEGLGSTEGITRRVPSPWTPLQVEPASGGFRVRCWGREYRFGKDSFVERISSGGRSLLAGPVRAFAKVNGRVVGWSGHAPRAAGLSPDQAVLSHTLTGDGLMLRTQAEVEFDGMVRFDWELTASRPALLEALTLEIPIRRECAKYFYQYRGYCGDDRKFGAITERRMFKGFRPCLWFGDDERGLAWFAESDQGWHKADPSRVTEVVTGGKTVLLRLHLVSSPVRLLTGAAARRIVPVITDKTVPCAASLRHTFGLQATPVKPVERDAWDHRIMCVLQNAPGAPSTAGNLALPRRTLDKLAGLGVRTVVLFEHWNDVEAHFLTTHKKEIRRIVRDCHARGIQVLLYFGFLLSESAPEWRDFGDKSVVLPRSGWALYKCPPQPAQTAWRVCLRSHWQEILVDGIGRALDELGADGVYLDGTSHSYACRNMLHGCGALRPDGSISPTYPIFSVRSAMRRIYAAVKSRRPDGQVNLHNSSCMTIPTLAWATSTWDGEQFAGLKAGRKVGDFLPLDTFRTEFMGHQWGVPAEFLCYGRPLTYSQSLAVCLLHDVPVRPFLISPDLELLSSVWRVMDEFGRKKAAWTPYWRSSDAVNVTPRGVQVSYYRHPANGALLVVANLSQRTTSVGLRLNATRLGLGSRRVEAFDAVTKDAIEMRGGRMTCKLPAFGWKLIRVRG